MKVSSTSTVAILAAAAQAAPYPMAGRRDAHSGGSGGSSSSGGLAALLSSLGGGAGGGGIGSGSSGGFTGGLGGSFGGLGGSSTGAFPPKTSGGLGGGFGGFGGGAGGAGGLGGLLGGLGGGSGTGSFGSLPTGGFGGLGGSSGSGGFGGLGGSLGGLGGASGGSSSGGIGSGLGGGATGSTGTGSTGSTGGLGGLLGGAGGAGGLGGLSGSGEDNDVTDKAACKANTFIFARGTGEPGTLGFVVGPGLSSGLKQDLGDDLNIQGVDYPADAAGNANLGKGPGADEMVALSQQALQQCPDTKLVLSGYSQGAMVVHAALQGGVDASKVGAVITFGDPLNGTPFSGVDGSKIVQICGSADTICAGRGGPITGTDSHTSYSDQLAPAAQAAADILKGGAAAPVPVATAVPQ